MVQHSFGVERFVADVKSPPARSVSFVTAPQSSICGTAIFHIRFVDARAPRHGLSFVTRAPPPSSSASTVLGQQSVHSPYIRPVVRPRSTPGGNATVLRLLDRVLDPGHASFTASGESARVVRPILTRYLASRSLACLAGARPGSGLNMVPRITSIRGCRPVGRADGHLHRLLAGCGKTSIPH